MPALNLAALTILLGLRASRHLWKMLQEALSEGDAPQHLLETCTLLDLTPWQRAQGVKTWRPPNTGCHHTVGPAPLAAPPACHGDTFMSPDAAQEQGAALWPAPPNATPRAAHLLPCPNTWEKWGRMGKRQGDLQASPSLPCWDEALLAACSSLLLHSWRQVPLRQGQGGRELRASRAAAGARGDTCAHRHTTASMSQPHLLPRDHSVRPKDTSGSPACQDPPPKPHRLGVPDTRTSHPRLSPHRDRQDKPHSSCNEAEKPPSQGPLGNQRQGICFGPFSPGFTIFQPTYNPVHFFEPAGKLEAIGFSPHPPSG